ncbi:MAG: L-threonylcarbamoyladenylate synthase [Planctomycetota bacterium]|jgi:L-threonylcarbamoyladenylate synthase|nr:L-threonylcarbamoyladenylate synthase [Planctomycetota bacterium]
METDPAFERAVAALRRGGLVGMPTETVYGLAALATNADAVLGIFSAKGRPSFDPLIVHVADAAQAWQVAKPDPVAERLAAACWPGPLTMVLPRRAVVPDAVTSGLETVGVRCPDHPLARALIAAVGPLAAPSANRFGCLSPTTAAAVREQLGAAVDEVLDGGPCQVGVESTVVRTGPEPVILRPGGVTAERLEAILGRAIPVADRATVAAGLPAEAPGMLASHYAPRAPLMLRDGAWPGDPDQGLLAFRGHDLPTPSGPCEVLSRSGDLHEAARNLFAALRRLDAAGVTRIVAEAVPAQGLGLAINDRLRRAAGLG